MYSSKTISLFLFLCWTSLAYGQSCPCSGLPLLLKKQCENSCSDVSGDVKGSFGPGGGAIDIAGLVELGVTSDVQSSLEKFSNQAAAANQNWSDTNQLFRDMFEKHKLDQKWDESNKNWADTNKLGQDALKKADELGNRALDEVARTNSFLERTVNPDFAFKMAAAAAAGATITTSLVDAGISAVTSAAKMIYDGIHELISGEKKKANLRELYKKGEKVYAKLSESRGNLLSELERTIDAAELSMALDDKYQYNFMEALSEEQKAKLSDEDRAKIEAYELKDADRLNAKLNILKVDIEAAAQRRDEDCLTQLNKRKSSLESELALAPQVNRILQAFNDDNIKSRHQKICESLHNNAKKLMVMDHELQMARLAIINGHFVSLEDKDKEAAVTADLSSGGAKFAGDAEDSLIELTSTIVQGGGTHSRSDSRSALLAGIESQRSSENLIENYQDFLKMDIGTYVRSERIAKDSNVQQLVIEQACHYSAFKCRRIQEARFCENKSHEEDCKKYRSRPYCTSHPEECQEIREKIAKLYPDNRTRGIKLYGRIHNLCQNHIPKDEFGGGLERDYLNTLQTLDFELLVESSEIYGDISSSPIRREILESDAEIKAQRSKANSDKRDFDRIDNELNQLAQTNESNSDRYQLLLQERETYRRSYLQHEAGLHFAEARYHEAKAKESVTDIRRYKSKMESLITRYQNNKSTVNLNLMERAKKLYHDSLISYLERKIRATIAAIKANQIELELQGDDQKTETISQGIDLQRQLAKQKEELKKLK